MEFKYCKESSRSAGDVAHPELTKAAKVKIAPRVIVVEKIKALTR
jgi:hypothetical protein